MPDSKLWSVVQWLFVLTRSSCEECVRLWRHYQTATTNHIHLCGKHRITELQYDKKKAADLLPIVQEAQQERNAARAAIKQHEADVHGVVDSSAAVCGEAE